MSRRAGIPPGSTAWPSLARQTTDRRRQGRSSQGWYHLQASPLSRCRLHPLLLSRDASTQEINRKFHVVIWKRFWDTDHLILIIGASHRINTADERVGVAHLGENVGLTNVIDTGDIR